MTALISTTAVLGSVAAVAPTASAAVGDDSYLTVNKYEKLDKDELAAYMNAPKSQGSDWSINLLPTNLGPGWCVDWGLGNGWNDAKAGYEPRKLTGASGRVGDGPGISEDVRLGAINTVKKLQADYKAYAEGDTSLARIQAIKTDEIALRALLGNDLAALSTVRGAIYKNMREVSDLGERESGTTPVVNNATFEQITGFKIVDTGPGALQYRIVANDSKISEFEKKYSNGEYVTILVPENYNFSVSVNRTKTFQRIVPIEQPGLNPEKPKWDGSITEWVTPPATQTTQTVTLPPSTVTRTVEQPPKDVTTTVTYPATTVTETNTLPPKTVTYTTTKPATEVTETITEPTTTYTNVRKFPPTTVTETTTEPTSYVTTRVTTPGREVTKTITPKPVTETVKTTVNGTPVTKTVEKTPEAYTTVVKTPGQPSTVTETVTAETKTVTKEPSTVVETVKTTPVKTTVETVPATTEVLTKTVTPAPQVATTTVVHNENYYVEKVYESVKEVREYYNFAGFVKGEKSKEIELPGNLGDSWMFEIIKGGDIVTVERTEDGKLKITPKPGFEGEGEVEILITDDQGNQYIYRVKVADIVNVETATKVKVNNFFYTINPGSEDRVRVITKNPNEKVDYFFTDKDGNPLELTESEVEVLDDENKVTVDVKDPKFRGNVVVRITEENGNVRENIVTVETTSSKFDVTRQILDTSTAIIERRGGDYKIISGEEKVEITQSEDGSNWVVNPKKGETGEVKIVFTDENGVDYNYTLEIVEDPNGGPTLRNDSINENDYAQIDIKDDWTYEIVEGGDIVTIDEVTDKDGKHLNAHPQENAFGTAIVHVKDKDGQIVAIWTIEVHPSQNYDPAIEAKEYPRDVVDRSTVRIFRGYEDDPEQLGKPGYVPVGNILKVVEGENRIDTDRSTMGETGEWELHFKPGATGRVVVNEYQRLGNGEEGHVTTFIYNIGKPKVREINYNVTSDNVLDLAGSNLSIVEGTDLIVDSESLPEDAVKKDENDQPKGVDKLSLDLKRDASGTIVIENRNENGYLFERYTINVTPGRDADVTPIKRSMSWNDFAQVNFNEDKEYPDTFKVVEGEDLIKVVEGKNKTLDISGSEDDKGEKTQKTGKAVIEVKDKRGVWAIYELNITNPQAGAREYTVSTNSAFVATLVKEQNRFQVVEGSQYFEPAQEKDGQWVLKPKEDAAGKTGVVVEYDKNGNELNRYRITITQGAVSQTRDIRTYLVEGEARKFKQVNEDNTFVVVSGSENVDYSTENGELTITAKPGTAGKKVRVEEHNSNGDVVRTLVFTVVPEGAVTSEGNTIGENKDFPGILDISNDTNAGNVTIEYQPGVKGLSVLEGDVIAKPRTDGKDGVIWQITEEGRAKIEKCIADKKAKGEKIEAGDCGIDVTYLAINKNNDQSYKPATVTVELKMNADVTGTRTEQKGSSGELDGKCIAGIVGLTAPLLLAIPLGILSQVQIPGLEGVSAQINGAIQDANNRIQQGLGIYDEDRAQRAAGIQGAFSIENPEQLGMAAGALGAISLGLLAVDGVMRACGAEEYTSSYMIGKATGSETLMNGSSGKSDNKDNKSTDKAEGKDKAEGSSNEEK